MNHIWKALALIGIGTFLYLLIINATLEMYIHPRFTMLTLVAALGLFLVGMSYFQPDRADAHEHASIRWTGLLIVALPLVLGWMVPPRPLGASAMENRTFNLAAISTVSRAEGGTTVELASEDKNILDWLSDFQRSPNPAEFDGQNARVTGFVYRQESFPTDTFMVSRFVVSCCAADGTPVSLVVQTENAAEFETDQWVEIEGTFEAGTFESAQIPILHVDSITRIDMPRQPYLYP